MSTGIEKKIKMTLHMQEITKANEVQNGYQVQNTQEA